jgi:hypothetical protein
MSAGPGKYDAYCTYVREATNAQGCVLIVIHGDKGMGVSIQIEPGTLVQCDIPRVLRELATKVEVDRKRLIAFAAVATAKTTEIAELIDVHTRKPDDN